MIRLNLTINGAARELDVNPGDTLLDTLRALGYHAVKRGCEAGTCGSCVVLVDGEPRFACILLTATLAGSGVTTAEALGSPEHPHPIMQAFAEEAGVQCGYCVPGMVLSAKALLDEIERPTEDQVKVALDAHLCRCTGYVKQIKGVLRASELMAAGRAPGGRADKPSEVG